MSVRARVLGLLVTLLAASVIAPLSIQAAAAPAPQRAAVAPAAPCTGALAAITEITNVDPVVPTAVDALANDCLGVSTASRPLTITTVGQGTYGTTTTDGTTIVYDPRGCATGDADGNDYVSYTITDGGSTKTGLAVIHFRRPTSTPVTDAPQAAFVANSTIGSTVPLKVSWCGVAATGSSVKSYRLEQGSNGGATFPTLITAATTSTSSTRNATPATNYAWRVRTTDSANRVGAYAASLGSRVTIIQDSSSAITYSSGWSTASGSKYSGGRERYTSKSGATATVTVSNVRAVAIVASKATGRGSFNVYVDGVKVTPSAVSQRSTTAVWKRVMYIRGLTSGAGVSHTVQFRAAGNGRVDLDAILTLAGKQDQAVSFTTTAPAGATYAGPTYAVAATTTSGLPVTLSVPSSSWAVCSLSGGTVSFHGAGTCRITATQSGDPTFNARTVTQTFAVAPIALTVTGITAQDRDYDGTTGATLALGGADLDESPVLSGDVVALSTAGASGSFANPNAGNGKTVQVAGLTLTGADAALYAITQPTTTASIAKLDLTVSFTAQDKLFDGTTDATIASCSLATAIAGDTVSCDFSGATATFDDAGIGTDKTVTGSGFALAGADAANYAIATVNTTTADINGPLTQTITFDLSGVTATYGDDPVAISATASSGLTVAFASQTSAVCTVSGSDVTMVTAGTCTIRASQPGDATYAAAPNVDESFLVDQRAITVTAVTDTKTADGTTASAGVPTITSGTLATGDTAAWTQSFDTPAVGTGKTLTPTGTVHDGLADVTASYDITFVAVTTGVIGPGPADVTTSTVSVMPGAVNNDGVDTVNVTVRLLDAFLNPLIASGGTVTVFANHGSVGTVTDNGDGSYSAVYTSDTFNGMVTVSAELDGTPIADTASINQH